MSTLYVVYLLRNSAYLPLSLLLWFFASVLHAQHVDYRFERFEEAAMSPAVDVEQDLLGFMWIGTQSGLYTYDGYSFNTFTYDPDDSTSLSFNFVHALEVDQNGTLWVGTHGGGLNRYNPGSNTFTRYQHDPNDPRSLSHDEIITLYEDSEGILWIGTSWGGLNRFDPETETFSSFLPNPSIRDKRGPNRINVIFEDREGTLWIGTGGWHRWELGDGGLYRFDRKTERFERVFLYPRDTDAPQDVWSITEDDAGSLWVGTRSEGLFQRDPVSNAFINYRHEPTNEHSLSGLFITSIVEDSDHPGTLWVTSAGFSHYPGQGGLDRLHTSTGKVDRFRHQPGNPNSISGNNVWERFEDRQGNLWVVIEDGINKMVPLTVQFSRIKHDPQRPEGLRDNIAVTSFEEDKQGGLWITSWGGGLHYFAPGTNQFTHFAHDPRNPESLGHNDTRIVIQDRTDNLWIGTRGAGLDRFDLSTQTFTHFAPDSSSINSPSGQQVTDLIEASNGTIWIGTYAHGIDAYNPTTKTFTNYNSGRIQKDRRGMGPVHTILEDQAGDVWAGTAYGLHRFNASTQVFDEVLKFYTLALYEDRAGRLWLGTSGTGLQVLDRETGERSIISVKDGLASNRVNCILEDSLGKLWVSTSAGISRVDPDTGFITNFGPNQGLPESDGYEHSCYAAQDGTLYFGGESGIARFNPKRFEINNTPPQVVLTDLQVAGEPAQMGVLLDRPIFNTQAITLRHDQSDISLAYAGLHFKDPSRNQYATMLEPYDSDWVVASQQRSVRYGHLAPGEYTFRVKAANSDLVWNEQGASLNITVMPPWWLSTWAYMLYALLLIGGVWGISRYQRSTLIRKERERATLEQAELRAEAAELKMKATTAEQARIATQEKLASLSLMTAGIAHEIRNPLNFVNNFATVNKEMTTDVEALIKDHKDVLANDAYEEVSEFLTAIQENSSIIEKHGERATLIIERMAQHAVFQGASEDKGSLHRLMKDLLDIAQKNIHSRYPTSGITINSNLDENTKSAMIRLPAMSKVMQNLLDNALEAVHKKAQVVNGSYTPDVTVLTQMNDAVCEVTVQDNGIGIPDNMLDKIFDPFFTTKEGHTGLGLSLCHTTVTQGLSGELSATSDVDAGTTFTVRLPVE